MAQRSFRLLRTISRMNVLRTINMDYFSNSTGPVEECLRDSGLAKRSVVLAGGSNRLPRVRSMIQESFRSLLAPRRDHRVLGVLAGALPAQCRVLGVLNPRGACWPPAATTGSWGCSPGPGLRSRGLPARAAAQPCSRTAATAQRHRHRLLPTSPLQLGGLPRPPPGAAVALPRGGHPAAAPRPLPAWPLGRQPLPGRLPPLPGCASPRRSRVPHLVARRVTAAGCGRRGCRARAATAGCTRPRRDRRVLGCLVRAPRRDHRVLGVPGHCLAILCSTAATSQHAPRGPRALTQPHTVVPRQQQQASTHSNGSPQRQPPSRPCPARCLRPVGALQAGPPLQHARAPRRRRARAGRHIIVVRTRGCARLGPRHLLQSGQPPLSRAAAVCSRARQAGLASLQQRSPGSASLGAGHLLCFVACIGFALGSHEPVLAGGAGVLSLLGRPPRLC